jgi:hypothetical protein
MDPFDIAEVSLTYYWLLLLLLVEDVDKIPRVEGSYKSRFHRGIKYRGVEGISRSKRTCSSGDDSFMASYMATR